MKQKCTEKIDSFSVSKCNIQVLLSVRFKPSYQILRRCPAHNPKEEETHESIFKQKKSTDYNITGLRQTYVFLKLISPESVKFSDILI